MEHQEIAAELAGLLLKHNGALQGAAPFGAFVQYRDRYFDTFAKSAGPDQPGWERLRDIIAERHPEVFEMPDSSEAAYELATAWDHWQFMWTRRAKLKW